MLLLETDGSLTLHIKLKQTSILKTTLACITQEGTFKTMTEETNIG